MKWSTLLWPAILLVLGGVAGCGDRKTTTAEQGDGGQSDAGGKVGACDGVPDFHLGIQALGNEGLVRGEVIEADPLHKFENHWVVKFTGPEGGALTDLELYKVEPYMPVHGHDGQFDPEFSEAKPAGTYDVARINLWMQDHWEVRFFVHVGTKDDEVIFNVCVPP